MVVVPIRALGAKGSKPAVINRPIATPITIASTAAPLIMSAVVRMIVPAMA